MVPVTYLNKARHCGNFDFHPRIQLIHIFQQRIDVGIEVQQW